MELPVQVDVAIRRGDDIGRLAEGLRAVDGAQRHDVEGGHPAGPRHTQANDLPLVLAQDDLEVGDEVLVEGVAARQAAERAEELLREDRVDAVVKNLKSFPLIEQFIGEAPVFLGGSTWSPDEEILFEIMKHYRGRMKFILAPHEIDPKRMESLLAELPIKGILYSKITTTDYSDSDVLIVDSIGILSHLYQYAYIAYIGGGFGSGIHNTLEAATFGIPIIFGPRYQEFREAVELL